MKQILEENNEKKEISIDDEKSELSITSTSNQENEITTKDYTSISNEKFTPNLPPPAPPPLPPEDFLKTSKLVLKKKSIKKTISAM